VRAWVKSGGVLLFMGLFMVSTGWKTSMWANPGRGFDSHRLHHYPVAYNHVATNQAKRVGVCYAVGFLILTDLDMSKTVHGAMRPLET